MTHICVDSSEQFVSVLVILFDGTPEHATHEDAIFVNFFGVHIFTLHFVFLGGGVLQDPPPKKSKTRQDIVLVLTHVLSTHTCVSTLSTRHL